LESNRKFVLQYAPPPPSKQGWRYWLVVVCYCVGLLAFIGLLINAIAKKSYQSMLFVPLPLAMLIFRLQMRLRNQIIIYFIALAAFASAVQAGIQRSMVKLPAMTKRSWTGAMAMK